VRVSERRRPPQIKRIDDVDFVPGASTSSCSDSRLAAAPPVSWSLVCFLVPARETVAPMRRRRRGSLRSHDSSTRDRFSSRVDGHAGARARAGGRSGARRRRPGRPRSHGGFVDSRAVRRRTGVLQRTSSSARLARLGGDARKTSRKADLLSPAALARATSSRLALSNVCMRVLRFVQDVI
jgi:hypothetical protein